MREIEAALQEHRIDLGLVEGVFRLPNLKYTTFLEDELVAVIRTGSKLQVGEEITPEELLHIPLVLRERDQVHWMFLRGHYCNII